MALHPWPPSTPQTAPVSTLSLPEIFVANSRLCSQLNQYSAPAIVEDNIINQLIKSGFSVNIFASWLNGDGFLMTTTCVWKVEQFTLPGNFWYDEWVTYDYMEWIMEHMTWKSCFRMVNCKKGPLSQMWNFYVFYVLATGQILQLSNRFVNPPR